MQLKDATVLVVDDELHYREIMTGWFEKEGSRALTPAQEQAYVLLCAQADRLCNHDLAAVEVMHAQAAQIGKLI